MFKTLIAGATALSLTFSPASAQGLDEDQIGRIIFGLFATAAIAKIIKDNNRPAQANGWTQPTPLVDHVAPAPRHPATPRNGRKVLPQRCAQAFHTYQGRVRMFTRSCIARHYRHGANFPRACEQDVMTRDGFRTGWAVRCMRNAGFRTNRRN
ncbi:MAG: hypothetical protein ACJAXK_001424 [Yoonia sp.]|jgi:hypothetical protein